jgi:hypothetical protein
MEVVLEVCDICGKKHGIMLRRDGVVFGDRRCFLDFCNSIWLRWEREEFEARGVIAKKESRPQNDELEVVEKEIVAESALVFKPQLVRTGSRYK